MKKSELRKVIREILSEETIAQIDTHKICTCSDGENYEFSSPMNVNYYGDCPTLCANYTMSTEPNPPVTAKRVRDKGTTMTAQNAARVKAPRSTPPIHPSMKKSQLRKTVKEILKKLK